MTFDLQLILYNIQMNQHVRCLGQRLFSSTFVVWTHRHTCAPDWLRYLWQRWNWVSNSGRVGSWVSVSDPAFDLFLSFNMRVYHGVSTE